MSSNTSKGLVKPDPIADFQDAAVLNANFDRLDTYGMGPYVCTSTTRPTGSNLWDGMIIFETDTKLLYIWDAVGAKWRPLGFGYDACAWQLDTVMNLTSGVFAKVAWGTQIETDAAAGITYAAGDFTVAEAGIYEAVSSVVFDNPSGSTQRRLSQIVTLNTTSIDGSGNLSAGGAVWDANTSIVAGIASLTGQTTQVKTRRKKLSAGDKISVFVFTDIAGVALSAHPVTSYSGYSSLAVQRIS